MAVDSSKLELGHLCELQSGYVPATDTSTSFRQLYCVTPISDTPD